MDEATGKTTYFLSMTPFYYRHTLLYDVVENTLLMIVLPCVTFTGVTLSTAITVLQLRRAVAWRAGSGTGGDGAMPAAGLGDREKVVVKMLVVVSCVYIATSAPNVALGLTRLLVPEFLHTRR